MVAGSPELAAAKRLLDLARDQGFVFQRVARVRTGRCSASGSPPIITTRFISATSTRVA